MQSAQGEHLRALALGRTNTHPISKSSMKTLRWSALIYLFSTPLEVIPLPFGSPARITGAIFLAVWAFSLLMGSAPIPRLRGLRFILLALVAWSFITVIWSYAPGVSFAQSITTLFLVLSAIAISGAIQGSSKTPIVALLLGSLVTSLAVIAEGPVAQTYASDAIGQATFLGVDQNIIAFHLSLGFASGTYLILSAKELSTRLASLVGIGILAVSLVMVGSRTGIGSLIVVIAVYLALALRVPSRAVVALGVSLLGLTLARWIATASLLPDRILTWLSNPVLTDSRTEIIFAYRRLQDEWVVRGIGAGADADFLQAKVGYYKNAHSAFWKVFIELGVVGLLVWAALLIGLAYLAYQSALKEYFALVAAPIALFFYSLGPINSNMLWAVFGVVLATNRLVAGPKGAVATGGPPPVFNTLRTATDSKQVSHPPVDLPVTSE